MRFFLLVSVLVLLFVASCFAVEPPCHNKGTTKEVLDCVKELTKQAELKAKAWIENNNKNMLNKEEVIAKMTKENEQVKAEMRDLSYTCEQGIVSLSKHFEQKK